MLPAQALSHLAPAPVEPDTEEKLKAARLLDKAHNALSLGGPEVADALLAAAAKCDPSNEKVWLCWAAPDGARVAWFDDPVGNVLSVAQR